MFNLDESIAAWRAGDQRAAESIYNLYRDRTFRLAYALVGNSEDAEEVAQDALAYALLNIDRYDERRSKFTTWLHMITVSRSRDVLRKRRRPTFSLTGWLERRQHPRDPRPGPDMIAEFSEMRSEVWMALHKLSPTLREAIVLRYWGGHTYQEIAEIVGCPLKTAQSRVRLAHQKLGQLLTETGLPESIEAHP
jgi:RNA polymerase sigma-70 factor (ECF subfamily)